MGRSAGSSGFRVGNKPSERGRAMRRRVWIGWVPLAVAALASVAGADEQEVRTLDFGTLNRALIDAGSPASRADGYHLLPSLRDVSADCGPAIGLIINVTAPPAASAGTPRVVNLMSLDDPGITVDDYAIVGMAEYGGLNGSPDMDGVGYLEMWSEFADGSRYFSRTLADAGPLRRLSGHSAARPFRLPFHADAARRPTRLILNLCLPGVAMVRLSDMRLVQEIPATQPASVAGPASRLDQLRTEEDRLATKLSFLRTQLGPSHPDLAVLQAELDAVRERIREVEATGQATMPLPPPWWARDRVTGTATGLFGLVGCLGFAEPLMRRGRARGLVLTLVVAVGVLGEAYFGWAMAVAGHGEPWRAWTPMLLCGVAGLCVPASIPIVNRRYREAELRRMRALDAVAA
jgi:hypothetical protein